MERKRNIYLGTEDFNHVSTCTGCHNTCSCTIEEPHCHNKNDECIALIEDCEEHAQKCSDDCHDECACKDSGHGF